jgi:putative heme-binding domain-containing protein
VQRLLGIASNLGDQGEVNRIIRDTLQRASGAPLSEQLAVATGLLSALSRRGVSGDSSLDADSARRFASLSEEARRLVADESAAVEQRLIAVRMLGAPLRRDDGDASRLAALLSPRQPPELQSAAMSAIANRFPNRVAELGLAGWRSHAPVLRAQILDALFSRPASVLEFIAALERGDVPTAHVDARRRQQLVSHLDGRIRDRAGKLFASDRVSSRAQVVEQFLPATTLAGNAERGKVAFGKRCAVCHKLDGVGQNVGPELTALTDKSPRSMLVGILDPNKAVEDKFLDYIAVTTDGRQVTGMVSSETSTSVTLTGQEAKQVTLRRNEIELLQSSGKSLMPEGMEKDLTAQDLADVIAYVRSVSAPAKQFPGNHPELAHVRDDGSIRLLAMHAKIYGPTLVFEDQYRNLGYWQSSDDHAVWMMQVPKGGKYQVRLDYACDDSAAGNRFIIAIGDQTVGGVIAGTGSWDRYRGQSLGAVQLAAGYAELVMRSDGPVRGALIDLRQIVLEPQE